MLLGQMLAELGLEDFEGSFCRLGVESIEQLAEVRYEEMLELGLSKVQCHLVFAKVSEATADGEPDLPDGDLAAFGLPDGALRVVDVRDAAEASAARRAAAPPCGAPPSAGFEARRQQADRTAARGRSDSPPWRCRPPRWAARRQRRPSARTSRQPRQPSARPSGPALPATCPQRPPGAAPATKAPSTASRSPARPGPWRRAARAATAPRASRARRPRTCGTPAPGSGAGSSAARPGPPAGFHLGQAGALSTCGSQTRRRGDSCDLQAAVPDETGSI
ncbi:unnamed protein product [Prorocentrum cordatum]|uniref:SAM domain-containing protein n=1 Tax=Prorocentrum cordatum TaxID=2364126 RepID=A0ABN9QTU7_9DINO|nr:unnamed protein product [Polarella glacialis]